MWNEERKEGKGEVREGNKRRENETVNWGKERREGGREGGWFKKNEAGRESSVVEWRIDKKNTLENMKQKKGNEHGEEGRDDEAKRYILDVVGC